MCVCTRACVCVYVRVHVCACVYTCVCFGRTPAGRRGVAARIAACVTKATSGAASAAPEKIDGKSRC